MVAQHKRPSPAAAGDFGNQHANHLRQIGALGIVKVHFFIFCEEVGERLRQCAESVREDIRGFEHNLARKCHLSRKREMALHFSRH
jgi:hypothetical protein